MSSDDDYECIPYDDDCDYYDEEEEEDGYLDGELEGSDGEIEGLDGEDVFREIKMEFSILNGVDIRTRLDADISEVSSLLSVPAEASLVLLCKHDWNISKVTDEWFSDEMRTRKRCGLMAASGNSSGGGPKKKGKGKGTFFCGICLENYRLDSVDHSAVMSTCGHVFCDSCWRTYVTTAIHDGAGSLFLRCPEPSCRASISDMISSLVSDDENRAKYENHILRSYVESRKTIKYCPAPGCEFAVECLAMDLSDCNPRDFEVTCKCLNRFCWNCSEEAHSPVDCETVAKWILKNSSESENANWVLANTKPCPKCRKLIEKNHGCMHMTCAAPCKFEFCWLCSGPWESHGENTGGYYACNVFELKKRKGEYDEKEIIRERAKNTLERYLHYYERWKSNDVSKKKALEDIKELPTRYYEKLSEIHSLTLPGWQFIPIAWDQIVQCRRVLKWSYTYGYYNLSENEPAKKQFFEYLQGEAEFNLERLHGKVEQELPKHCVEGASTAEFHSFGINVVHLTALTRNFFQKLVTALDNGLSEVDGRA